MGSMPHLGCGSWWFESTHLDQSGGLVIVASTVDLHSTRKGSIPLSSTKKYIKLSKFCYI